MSADIFQEDRSCCRSRPSMRATIPASAPKIVPSRTLRVAGG